MNTDPVVGIDLGTTFSVVARVVDGRPEVVRDGAGDPVFVPSVVSFAAGSGAEPAAPPSGAEPAPPAEVMHPRGSAQSAQPRASVLVGEAALERAAFAPERTVRSVKRLMGLGLQDLSQDALRLFQVDLVEQGPKLVKVRIDDQLLTPQEVSAWILRELKRRAEAGLGCAVRRAVITVPAYFDDAQRQATRDAGKIAGLDVLRIVNEPTAASLAYGLGAPGRDGVIAVYDFGGGTFDLSLLSVQAGTFRVLATCGDTCLGGDDLDRLLVERAQAVLRARGVDAADRRLVAQLRLAAERAKIELSDAEETVLRLDDPTRGVALELPLTRRELEEAARPLVDRTIDLCRRALAQAQLRFDQVGEVVLVGGTTLVPYVRRRVAEAFGRTPHTGVDPKLVVALGAAVQADILAGNRGDVLLLDVIPLSLGIETYGGAVTKLIMANTSIPTQATEEYTTPQDNVTSIDLHVLQGERELVRDCRSLARFKLRIPPMPAGMPKVKVTFLVDADGILRVLAHEERSGAEASIEVVPVHGLTGDEVDAIMAESIEHALADVAAHRLIDLRNEAATVVRAARRTLASARDAVGAAQADAIEAAAAALERLCERDDGDAIKAGLDALNHAAEPLAELVLNRVAKELLGGKRLTEVES